ncbi:MAG TPA: methyltransferase domain-containing protein [Micrococcaceae bacterium]
MKFLQERDTDARELMDAPDCDAGKLERTYARFGAVNAVVSGLRHTYRTQLRPRFARGRPTTLLDLGCGGGDAAAALARWAARDGLDLRVTGADPDERAYRFAAARAPRPNLAFRQAFSSELVAEGLHFDLVISNHVLHHLDAAALAGFLADSVALARAASVHADLARHPLAYALFSAGALPVAPGSFIRTDGLTSIRRSYTPGELRAAVPAGWTVTPEAPFRQLLIHEGPAGAAGTDQ